jgi:hypothetical protein
MSAKRVKASTIANILVAQTVLVAVLRSHGGIHRENALAAEHVPYQHDDAGRDADTKEQVGREPDDP